jgi:hypothetical protein
MLFNMSSKKKRTILRKYSHPLNILEDKYVQFTSGPWEGCEVHIGRRSNKGIWSISKYEIGWDFDKISDNKLIEYSKEVRMLMRDVRLTNLLNQS